MHNLTRTGIGVSQDQLLVDVHWLLLVPDRLTVGVDDFLAVRHVDHLMERILLSGFMDEPHLAGDLPRGLAHHQDRIAAREGKVAVSLLLRRTVLHQTNLTAIKQKKKYKKSDN